MKTDGSLNVSNATLARLCVAFVWFYHGLVPKLLGPDAIELEMNQSLGLSLEQATHVAYVAGAMEIALALAILIFWRKQWPLWLSIIGILGLLGFVVLFKPALLVASFNPFTINVCVAVLSYVGLQISKETQYSAEL